MTQAAPPASPDLLGSPAANPGDHSALPRQPFLDGWRGLAILLVLDAHFTRIGPLHLGLSQAGRLGVDVFFCLSGLLMSRLLFEKRMPLGLFYKRRFSRVYPAFFVYMIGSVVIALASGITPRWDEVLSCLAFMRTYFPTDPWIWKSQLNVDHFWSLNVEEHSYLLLGLVTLVAMWRRFEAAVILGLAMATLVLFVVFVKRPGLVPPWGTLGTEIVASHLLFSAGYRRISPRVERWVQSWMPLLAIAASFACYSAVAPWWAAPLVAPFTLAFAVNHLHQAPGWLLQLLASRVVVWFGLYSFSIYLWQQPFFHGVRENGHPAWLALAGALLTAWLSFRFIESPARNYLNRHWH